MCALQRHGDAAILPSVATEMGYRVGWNINDVAAVCDRGVPEAHPARSGFIRS